jgi:hypothetical protein
LSTKLSFAKVRNAALKPKRIVKLLHLRDLLIPKRQVEFSRIESAVNEATRVDYRSAIIESIVC